jgi:hypothetical protein
LAYVGNKELLRRHNATLVQFEKNFASNNWQTHNDLHFDWWAFPFDRGKPAAALGDRYDVPSPDIELLKKNKKFLKSLARIAMIQMWSYGWDIEERKVLDVSAAQLRQRQAAYSNNPVRLRRLGLSLKTFGLIDEFLSILEFIKYLGKERLKGEEGAPLLQRRYQGLQTITLCPSCVRHIQMSGSCGCT